MATNHNDAVIVRSTVELGHNLGLKVVAEGVEDQAAWDQAQGTWLRFGAGVLHESPVAFRGVPGLVTEIAVRFAAKENRAPLKIASHVGWVKPRMRRTQQNLIVFYGLVDSLRLIHPTF